MQNVRIWAAPLAQQRAAAILQIGGSASGYQPGFA
jgi:hypothetical protein